MRFRSRWALEPGRKDSGSLRSQSFSSTGPKARARCPRESFEKRCGWCGDSAGGQLLESF